MIQNSSNGDVKVFRNTLHLTNLNAAIEGMYQCAANNTHGVTFSSAQLRILSKLEFYIRCNMFQLTNLSTAREGRNVSLCH